MSKRWVWAHFGLPYNFTRHVSKFGDEQLAWHVERNHTYADILLVAQLTWALGWKFEVTADPRSQAYIDMFGKWECS